MRLAILSDVHGNVEALEAVLRDVERRGVEGLFHLGDLVGHGPRPNEAVHRVRSEGIAGVVGNYDLAVCHPVAEEARSRYLNPALSAVGEEIYRWTREHVADEALSFLRKLPAQTRIEEGDTTFLFTHGSPERPNEYLRADTPASRLEEFFEGTGATVLVVGHTHIPLARQLGECLLLNPGSVGRPKDGDPRASYLILDTNSGLRAESIRVEFDVESVAAESIRSGLPIDEANGLRAGRGI